MSRLWQDMFNQHCVLGFGYNFANYTFRNKPADAQNKLQLNTPLAQYVSAYRTITQLVCLNRTYSWWNCNRITVSSLNVLDNIVELQVVQSMKSATFKLLDAMYVCMYVYIYIYICTHTCIDVCIYIYIYT